MASSKARDFAFLLAFAIAILTQSINAEQVTREIEEQQVGPRAAEGKYLAFSPALLSRFIYSFRPSERQSSPLAAVSMGGPAAGFKRSSSGFDALSANVLGKRSAPTLGLINYEPLLNRPSVSMRPAPRGALDMRWAPLEALENPYQTEYN